MRTEIRLLASALLCLNLARAQGQPGASTGATGAVPQQFGIFFSNLGDFPAYSASVEMHFQGTSSVPAATVLWRVAALDGKRRIEMDFGAMLTNSDPDYFRLEGIFQEKGMRVIFVLRPDKHVYWERWSCLESYIERPLKDSDVIRPQSDVRIEVTELGNETVDGHPCVKNKVVETDKKGRKHEYTVWNATDLKKFPVKIETGVQTGEQRSTVTILIKDVKLGAPDAALFEPPAAKKANALTLLLDLTKLMRSMKNDRSITNSN